MAQNRGPPRGDRNPIEWKRSSPASDQQCRGICPPGHQFRSRRSPRHDLRLQRLHQGRDAGTTAQGGVQVRRGDHRQGRQAGPRRRRLGRGGHERLGHGEGRHPLRPRLLPDDRPDRREARQLLGARLRRASARRVRRQDPHPGRARCLQLPVGWAAQHLRGTRLHRLGRHQPGLRPGEPEWQHPVHPDGVRLDDR